MLKDTTCCYVCTHIRVSHASMLHGLTSDAMAYDAVGTFRPSLDACAAAGCLWSDPAGSTLTKRRIHSHETRALSSSKMAQTGRQLISGRWKRVTQN